MRALRSAAFAALLLAMPAISASAQGPISNLPRDQTLIVENPEGTIKNAGAFNRRLTSLRRASPVSKSQLPISFAIKI
jgi:hypothetical protein